MTTLSSINPMPIDLVLFLKRNMDMIAKHSQLKLILIADEQKKLDHK
jgi:hypothetical protein